MTKTQEIIDKFVELCGSLAEWDNDKKEWHSALGFFIRGWIARDEHVEGKESVDYCRVCKKMTVRNGYDLCTICHSRNE